MKFILSMEFAQCPWPTLLASVRMLAASATHLPRVGSDAGSICHAYFA